MKQILFKFFYKIHINFELQNIQLIILRSFAQVFCQLCVTLINIIIVNNNIYKNNNFNYTDSIQQLNNTCSKEYMKIYILHTYTYQPIRSLQCFRTQNNKKTYISGNKILLNREVIEKNMYTYVYTLLVPIFTICTIIFNQNTYTYSISSPVLQLAIQNEKKILFTSNKQNQLRKIPQNGCAQLFHILNNVQLADYQSYKNV
eukprot:TRINITY_DN1889_c1_g1_i15.p1 TRINITY_DN1889_c1_g1~~TRINITY_DN1889_c1_g1_i15.p1  ORF type:complete len:202 (-),score=-11.30 TRINITY_DN1889_c1_g1_i15:448-1053(-)